jgi:hypothetical protein
MRRIAAVVLVLLLAGCGGGGSKPTVSEPGARPAAASSVAARDAAAVVRAFEAAIPTAHLGTVFTEATDPNHKLGRPGGYSSKATWTDTRIPPDVAEDGQVERGGTVEVFGSAANAKARSDYVQAGLKAAGFLGSEYHYLRGGVLVRVSGQLTPDQAAEYDRALG